MPPLRIIALLTFFAHPLLGGVVLDGSFGTHGALPGPNFMISANYGRQIGGNLFQSFSQFNLNNSQSATFCGSNTVQNILARVTGGSPSSIDGRIKIDPAMGDANLFLMNPAGVLFGKNAQLDVKGSFAVSTANYLKLADGGKFNTSLGGGDVLTAAPVSAFGFLSAAPAPVSFTGSTLNVAPRKSFSLVAGDITMSGGTISGEGSRVNVVSVKSTGEAKLDPTNINSAVDVTQFARMGDISLNNSATIDMAGPLGGPVVLSGGNLDLGKSQIMSDTLASVQGSTGGTIDVAMTGTITISPGGLVRTRTYGKGNAGDVTVTADSLLIDAGGVEGGAAIFARAENGSTGHGGNIVVQVHNVKMTNAGRIAATTAGRGSAGDIHVTADLLLIGGGLRSAIAANGEIGKGGNVTVTAGNVKLTGNARIAAITRGLGNAGNVIVTADSLLIGGGLRSAIAANGKIGKGGNVTVTAGNVKLTGNARIAAITQGLGNAGNVIVTADSLLVNGMGLSPGSTGVFADVEAGNGNGGSVMIDAHDVKLVAGGLISARTLAKGQGGNVIVNADSVLIDGAESGISAVALPDSSGTGGDVFVSADDLLLQNGGNVSAASFTSAAAGSVHLRLGTLTMDTASSISSANNGTGLAGKVVIDTAGAVELKGGSSISTSSEMSDAGSIDIVSGGEIKLKGHSSISVSAGANGGEIHITAPELVYLLNSQITATAGINGGNIRIDSQFIVLNNSLISANAAVGQGGNINLVSDFFFNSDLSNNNITATGTTNGTVNITAPQLDLGSELITLPTSLLSAESQLQERCMALLRGDFSSFISIGRGGTEPAPEELQSTF